MLRSILSLLILGFSITSAFNVGRVNVFTNSNYGGSSTYVTNPSTTIFGAGSPYYNSISSLQLIGQVFVKVYTGSALNGTCWAFGPFNYTNLAPYGINDQIKSLTISDSPFYPYGTEPGVIFFKDTGLSGKSATFGRSPNPFYWTSIQNAIDGCGSMDNNAVTSMRVFGRTSVSLYKTVGYFPAYCGRVNNNNDDYQDYTFPIDDCPNDSLVAVLVGSSS